jgi:flagellar biosynthesis GTPase FlhF
MDTPNPRAVAGSNITGDVAARLTVDYAELLRDIEDALGQGGMLPHTVEGPEDVAAVSSHAVKLRDLKARAEAARVAEKEPHLRAGEVVDAFFKTPQEKLEGLRRVLSSSVDAYKQAQLRAERERREAEAREARRREDEARKAREEAEAAARRARSPERKEQHEQDAAFARTEETVAAEQRERATVETMVKPAEMVRERFEGRERSGVVTMRKTPVVYIEDSSLLDLELLRPFIREEHLLTALKAWAKATNYAQKMPGAVAVQRDETVIR